MAFSHLWVKEWESLKYLQCVFASIVQILPEFISPEQGLENLLGVAHLSEVVEQVIAALIFMQIPLTTLIGLCFGLFVVHGGAVELGDDVRRL